MRSPACRTALSQGALKSLDPDALNDGSDVEIRLAEADLGVLQKTEFPHKK